MLIECNECNATVDAKLLYRYDVVDQEVGIDVIYSFLKCPSCGDPLLVWQFEEGHGWTDPYRVYPAQEKEIDPKLPKSVIFSFNEARLCLKAKANTAAAIMCRKTLESICAAHNIKSNNLASSLKKMKEQGSLLQK